MFDKIYKIIVLMIFVLMIGLVINQYIPKEEIIPTKISEILHWKEGYNSDIREFYIKGEGAIGQNMIDLAEEIAKIEGIILVKAYHYKLIITKAEIYKWLEFEDEIYKMILDKMKRKPAKRGI